MTMVEKCITICKNHLKQAQGAVLNLSYSYLNKYKINLQQHNECLKRNNIHLTLEMKFSSHHPSSFLSSLSCILALSKKIPTDCLKYFITVMQRTIILGSTHREHIRQMRDRAVHYDRTRHAATALFRAVQSQYISKHL